MLYSSVFAMSILTANGIVVRYNDRVVLDGLTLSIGERDRIGMVVRPFEHPDTALNGPGGVQGVGRDVHLIKPRGKVENPMRIDFGIAQQFTGIGYTCIVEGLDGGGVQ